LYIRGTLPFQPNLASVTSFSTIPIACMTWLEGRMFHQFGVHGLLGTDAVGNLLVFAIVTTAFLSRVFFSSVAPIQHR
jgi:hypothetical protein